MFKCFDSVFECVLCVLCIVDFLFVFSCVSVHSCVD